MKRGTCVIGILTLFVASILFFIFSGNSSITFHTVASVEGGTLFIPLVLVILLVCFMIVIAILNNMRR